MQFTPDGLVEGQQTNVQVKTSRLGDEWGEPETDEVPKEILLQSQHEMIVLGAEVTDIPVLMFNLELHIFRVEADKELQEMIIEAEYQFWHENILKRIEPEIQTIEDIKKRYRFSNGLPIEANDDTLGLIENLKSIKNSIKIEESMKEDLEKGIKLFMGENEVLEYCGQSLATWKSTKPGVKFDTKAFEAAHPDLYNQFLIESASQRRFLVK